MVLVMQRVHEDDLAGHLLEKGGWSLLRLPAIATEAEAVALGQGRVHRRAPGELLEPGRLSMAELEEARRHLGAQLFEAQYQQDPIPAGGTLIKADWLATYAGPPPGPDGFPEVVQSWDVASKAGGGNDWSVCTSWGLRDGRYWLLDVRRVRLEFPDLLRLAAGLAEEHAAARVLVEDASSGTALAQALPAQTRARRGADPAEARQAGAGAAGVRGVRGRPGAAAGAGAVGGRVPARAAGLPRRAARRPSGQHHPVPDLGGGAAQAQAADPDRGHLHPQPAGLDFASGRRLAPLVTMGRRALAPSRVLPRGRHWTGEPPRSHRTHRGVAPRWPVGSEAVAGRKSPPAFSGGIARLRRPNCALWARPDRPARPAVVVARLPRQIGCPIRMPA